MKKIFLGLMFLLGGCSAGVNSSLLSLNVDASLPFLGNNDRQEVVYPSQTVSSGAAVSDPEWKSVEKDYSEYNFNP